MKKTILISRILKQNCENFQYSLTAQFDQQKQRQIHLSFYSATTWDIFLWSKPVPTSGVVIQRPLTVNRPCIHLRDFDLIHI